MKVSTVISTFKICKTVWNITFEPETETYKVYKNGKEYDLCNGSEYETETEAEINILLEYKL